MDVNQITSNIMLLAIGLLVVAGVLVGATSLRQTGFTCSGSNISNTSYMGCTDGVSQYEYKTTAATNVSTNLMGMTNAFTQQLGTVGTMFGVALILGAIGLIGLGIGVGVRNMR
jgi:hypothetical protein